MTSAIQTQIDSKAADADLTSHTGASTGVHGATGSVVGTTDAQTLTNKTIVVANNTVTTAASGNLTSTELDAALAELQTDIDTRATSSALTSHTGASTGVHGVTGSVVGTSDTQDLSNKTFTDSITLEEQGSTPSTPAAGDKKLYAKTDGKLYTLDDGGTELEVGSGSGSGSGELNLIADSSTSDNWAVTGTLAAATESSAAQLPLGPDSGITTGITLSSGSATDYARYRFQIGEALKNTKLKVQLYAQNDGADDDFTVELYKNSASDYTGSYTQFTLTNEDIKAGNKKFLATFDSDDADYYELRIVRAAGSSDVTLQQVIVGPGAGLAQGAIVTEWQAYTPGTAGFGTITSDDVRYRRVGSSLEVQGEFTNGTVSATEAQIGLPTGLSIGGATGPIVVGKFETDQAQSDNNHNILATAGDTFVNVARHNMQSTATNMLAPANANAFSASSIRVAFSFTVPISEWAGSGTVNLGENDVEFFSHDGSATVYGLDGSLVPNQSLGTTVTRSFTFSSPQRSDSYIIEYNVAGNGWAPAEQFCPGITQGANEYGIAMNWSSSTQLDVSFKKGGPFSNNATYANNGTVSWANYYSAGHRWRVRKTKPGVAVGFSTLSENSSGLMPANHANLDDAAATRLGLKSYSHGTSYNGGNAPTVTLSSGGGTLSSVQESSFIPYQLQDGSWRMKFNLITNVSSTSRTEAQFAINGVTFKNVGGATNGQAVTGFDDGSGIETRAFAGNNSGVVGVFHGSTTTAIYLLSGDVSLEAKPTWAY